MEGGEGVGSMVFCDAGMFLDGWHGMAIELGSSDACGRTGCRWCARQFGYFCLLWGSGLMERYL